MSIKRFFAKTTSEALRKVRDAFGSDGLILSNRSMSGGIEILALRQDDIAALVPAPAPEESGAERPGTVSFSQLLPSSSGVKADERKRNEVKSGHEARSFSLASREDLLNYFRKADAAGKDLHASGASPRQSDERKQEPDCGVSPYSNLDPASIVTAGVVARGQAEHSQTVETTQTSIRKPRSTRRSSLIAGHAENQPACNEASKAATPDKRRSKSRSATAKTSSDPKITRKRKPVQTSAVDTRQLADEMTACVLKEIKSMRSALEQKFSSINRNGHERDGSAREPLLSKLLAAGFSAPLVHGLIERLTEYPDGGNNEEEGMKRIRAALIQNLETIANEDEILEKGGIYALVGPTGVGKTTTTAKLAARCVVRHGADKLALLTTDGYRIGGHEQLRIYGKILGVRVYAVKDAQDLAVALSELQGKHMVLIDTVGVGQRDQMVVEQMAMFAGCGTEVRRLLLLNASSSLHTLNEVAEAYRGNGLAGAIITKLDEAVVTGCALDTAIRHRLPLYYVAHGQRVPEDLELADARHLVNLALDNPPAPLYSGAADALPPAVMLSKAVNVCPDMDGVHLD
ncbi:MAG: flagellar biosynthesis protein FlhF [Betaproteobacteria bacterium]|nr:flagellar biosynthesis protein FlhF [Betaproteobacteria bacterium]